MPKTTVRKTVELDEENVNWFYETYSGVSGKASLSWILDMMLSEFRRLHTTTPEQVARISAGELKNTLEA